MAYPGSNTQPHPTVPYGQGEPTPPPPAFVAGQPQNNGQGGQQGGQQYNPQQYQQQTQPQQSAPQQYQAQPPQQQSAPAQPHPTVPYGQQFNQQPSPQQQAQQAGLDPNMVLDGPGVPTELRGRTVGQLFSIYGRLAQHYISTARSGQPQGQQPASSQPQNFQQSGQQPNQQPPQQGGQQQSQGDDWDWSNPQRSVESAVQKAIQTSIQPMLQPLVQRNVSQSAQEAKQVAASQVHDFATLAPFIEQQIGGLNPEALANPQTWIHAADLVRGQMIRMGQYPRNGNSNQGGESATPFGQPAIVPGQQYNPQVQQPGLRSVPASQPHQYFTESPTPPASPEFGAGALSPQERAVAQAMGMTPESYAAWKGGVAR